MRINVTSYVVCVGGLGGGVCVCACVRVYVLECVCRLWIRKVLCNRGYFLPSSLTARSRLRQVLLRKAPTQGRGRRRGGGGGGDSQMMPPNLHRAAECGPPWPPAWSLASTGSLGKRTREELLASQHLLSGMIPNIEFWLLVFFMWEYSIVLYVNVAYPVQYVREHFFFICLLLAIWSITFFFLK